MKITVVGTGYVGLVTGACFAETGVEVSCIDNDKNKIDQLKKGIVPIYEPGLEAIVERNVSKGRLNFSTSLADSIEGSEVVFIGVGTPPDEDGSADLTHVLSVAGEIGDSMSHYMVVVTKSTVPVGTAEKVRERIRERLKKRGVTQEFDVSSNPEFLKEGSAIQDFLRPERIVIGIDSEKAESIMKKLYKPFLLNNHPILFMDIPSAELTKYAANSMLASRISFINEIANLCEVLGADINQVRRGIGSDSRIGSKFIYAGVGYGGSCFPKDVKALIKTADENGMEMSLLKAVEQVNNSQKLVLFQKIKNHFHGELEGKQIAVWGLAFKPHTDDMREAPSLEIISRLLKAGARVTVYDPVAMREAERILGSTVEFADDIYEAVDGADGLALITEWSEFRIPDFNILAESMKQKVIFDGRNIYDPAELRSLGFTYYAIGRKV